MVRRARYQKAQRRRDAFPSRAAAGSETCAPVLVASRRLGYARCFSVGPMRPALTVLTDPIATGRFIVRESFKRLLRPLRRFVAPPPAHARSVYRGHFAVTRSVVEGLRSAGVNANYNPTRVADVADAVVVLNGVEALAQAISWRREGRIRRLLAGPNILTFAGDHGGLIASPEVDVCVTPAPWVNALYIADCPELEGRCAAWPAGVDTAFWRPDRTKKKRDRVLIYEKRNKGPIGDIDDYVSILQKRGLDVSRIGYGGYNRDQYLAALQEASLMVGFVSSESQGLAWAEAWSADVPTLIRAQDRETFLGRAFDSSTAPYLCEENGSFFRSLDRGLAASVRDFEEVVTRWEANRERFRAREWTLQNMSDEVCARKLCDLAGIPTGDVS